MKQKKNGTEPADIAAELSSLRRENTRLKALLHAHGITDQGRPQGTEESTQSGTTSATKKGSQLSTSEKVTLFRRLFRGRADVYSIRWESSSGKSGYAPACGNEWKPAACAKPRVKCGECDQRLLLAVTDQVIYDHLSGQHTIGVYPLLPDDTCFFLAIDFDESSWQKDAQAFAETCDGLGVPVALEVSRSGQGAHAWIFFSEAIPARDARRLGAALISHTCARTRQLALTSYDRLFPSQDSLPKGGFGNLIALPLQRQPREQGRSVFVNELFEAFTDQWAFLSSVTTMDQSAVEEAIFKAMDGRHPLDVAFLAHENELEPWRLAELPATTISGLPTSIKLVLANQIFIEKADLPQTLINRLIRLAAFQNPEFYKAQSLRLAVWNKPRIIGCAENHPQHIGLPRGCLDAVLDLLARNGIETEIQEERQRGSKITARFTGELRPDQEAAVKALLKHEIGIFCAPTAFGKTVCAASLIAKRPVSTLILVHRTELLRQWQERIATWLDLPENSLGVIGGGKKKPSGSVDIAVMQSLTRREDLAELLDGYGQIIIDECHHLSAFSFESILKQARARYVLGLTATPVRRDGHQPIIFMQCGPIRHHAVRPESAPSQLEVWPQMLEAPVISPEAGIQEVFRSLATHPSRNRRIVQDIIAAYRGNRKIIVLTERTAHLQLLEQELGDAVKNIFILHGRLSKKQRASVLDNLARLDEQAPRVLIATGRLVGEGLDHPPLDTLVLSMPISWRGTLQQYAGRLHREHADKRDVRIYDYVEHDHPQLARMWNKRLRGYRAMGYTVLDSYQSAVSQ